MDFLILSLEMKAKLKIVSSKGLETQHKKIEFIDGEIV
jgi:hypothetical protein